MTRSSIFLIAAYSVIGCNQVQYNISSSRGKSEIKRPSAILDGSSWQWANLNRDQYTEVVHGGIDANSGQWKKTEHNFLPIDDPRSIELQNFAFEIDKFVQESQPELSKGIPQPEVVIDFRDKPGVLAVTKNVFSCYSANFKREGSNSTKNFSRINIQRFLNLEPISELPCAYLEDGDRLKNYVNYINSEQVSSCRYDVVTKEGGTIEIVANDSCIVLDREYQQIEGEVTADQIVFFQTARQIVVYKSLLDKDNETYLASVIAHELAHYYRAHPVNFPQGLTYRIDRHRYDTRPEFNEGDREILDKFESARSNIPGWMNFYRVDGQKFHPASMNMTYWMLGKLTSDQCRELRGIWNERVGKWDMYPYANMPEVHIARYFQFESAAEDCFKSLSFANVVQDTAEFKLFFGLDQERHNFDTLFDAFITFSNMHITNDRDVLPKLKEVTDRNIFIYNFELEADEISINFAAPLNLPVKDLIMYDIDPVSNISENSKCHISVVSYLESTKDTWQNLVNLFDGPWRPGVIANPDISDCFRVVNKAISFKRSSFL